MAAARVHACFSKALLLLLLLLLRAFFEAGMAWKAAGRHSMAFVILNRFLDLADAQDDPGVHSLAELENADFASTGDNAAQQCHYSGNPSDDEQHAHGRL